ncbi:MAG: hypothetical protein ABI221_00230 [Candidatus Saccharimonadales bacterium]
MKRLKKAANKFYDRSIGILQSNRFFYAVLIFFVLESAWIALSGIYSMAYDENTHFGIMQLYAQYHRLLPFWSSQPPGSYALGPLTHDTSYMYRFLLSFPLRWVQPLLHTVPSQVLVIRFISIAMFGVGLVIFRRLLLKTKASKAMVHVVLALFVLTPMVPFLAAQINYDNMLFPLTGLTFLLGLKVIDGLRKEHRLNIRMTMWLIIVCIFSSLVMYAFLPIFLAIGIFVAVLLLLQIRSHGLAKIWQRSLQSFTELPIASKMIVPAILLLSLGLFGQSYGYNLVNYHTPVARCGKISSLEDCLQYGPFKRDYESHRDLLAGDLDFQYTPNPISFIWHDWVPIMKYSLFFTLNGEQSHFKLGESLPLPMIMANVIAGLGGTLLIVYQKRIRQQYRLTFLVLTSLTYVGVLWFQEYTAFQHNGYAVAIQGRYLVPVLLVLYLVIGLTFAQALRRWPSAKAGLAWLTIAILLLQGGGSSVFIIRSNNDWYWSNSTVQRVNHDAQKVLKTFVVGS